MVKNNGKFDEERRKYVRLKKNFILTYFNLNDPDKKYELSQLKNISKGGLCFVTTQGFEPGTQMGLDIKTPYIADITYLEGSVLTSHEKVKGIIYETRLEFDDLSVDATFMLNKMIEFFEHGKGSENE